MHLTLEPEIQQLVAREVREGRFSSPEALVSVALQHFAIAQKYGQEQANKLAVLREEIWQARADVAGGHYTDYSVEDLPNLQESVEQRAMVKRKVVKT